MEVSAMLAVAACSGKKIVEAWALQIWSSSVVRSGFNGSDCKGNTQTVFCFF
jgi:hypothetical protein